jgi:hypothetical protein
MQAIVMQELRGLGNFLSPASGFLQMHVSSLLSSVRFISPSYDICFAAYVRVADALLIRLHSSATFAQITFAFLRPSAILPARQS